MNVSSKQVAVAAIPQRSGEVGKGDWGGPCPDRNTGRNVSVPCGHVKRSIKNMPHVRNFPIRWEGSGSTQQAQLSGVQIP